MKRNVAVLKNVPRKEFRKKKNFEKIEQKKDERARPPY